MGWEKRMSRKSDDLSHLEKVVVEFPEFEPW